MSEHTVIITVFLAVKSHNLCKETTLNPDFMASDLKVIVFKCFSMSLQRATLLKIIIYSMFQMETCKEENDKENIL
jgi:hypothetical protein